MTNIRKVALIGTGIMGAPIAGHVMDAGFDLTVHNRTKSKAAHLVTRGAHWADTVADAVAEADVVLTMVGYPDDVEDVYLASDGVLRHAKRGAYLVDLTTSAPQLARDIHDAAEVDGIHAFDCPVTGGDAGAIAGTLTLIAGATEKDVAPVLPVLSTFMGRIFYMGGAGKGQIAKLCNQVSLAACMMGYADAMALAEQGGLDVAQMLEMVGSGMGGSVALERLAPKSLEGDFRPGFLSEHFRKDIGLALRQAEDTDIALPSTETAFSLYDTLCQIGGSRLGTQAITLLYQDEAAAVAAGLDWSLAGYGDEGDDGCDCGCDHDHDHHDCGCGHHHEGD